MTNIHKINEFIENNNIKNELTSNFERLLKNTSEKVFYPHFFRPQLVVS